MSDSTTADQSTSDPDFEARNRRADHLRERIYLSFAALAVLLAIESHGHPDPLQSFLTLLVTMLGTLLAVFLADVISFIVSDERAMTRAERGHAVWASFGALGAVTLPFVFLLLAVFGVLEIELALRISIITLVVTLVLIGWAAVHKIPLKWWQRLIALGAEAALAIGVIGLQFLAHSA